MARGSAGSLRVRDAMSLPESHWKQFRNVRWPGRSDAQIDHVLVGPSGVYVIHYPPSEPQVRDDGGAWCEPEVAQSSEAARAVAGLLLPRYQATVRPLVCFLSDDALADVVDGVTITSRLALEHILRSSPVVLSTCEVAEVSGILNGRLEPVPLVAPESSARGGLRRRMLAGVAAAAVVGVGAAFGPEFAEISRAWF